MKDITLSPGGDLTRKIFQSLEDHGFTFENILAASHCSDYTGHYIRMNNVNYWNAEQLKRLRDALGAVNMREEYYLIKLRSHTCKEEDDDRTWKAIFEFSVNRKHTETLRDVIHQVKNHRESLG